METITAIVLQPTTLCNLNCEYCYLPNRQARRYMSLKVLKRISEFISRQNLDYPVSLIWHGGEPLATGIKRFQLMLQTFEGLREQGKVQHYIQTNATLITDEWCQLFEEFNFKIGVSIDGPAWLNTSRLDWAGKESYERIMQGIDKLKQHDIKFSTIGVVGLQHIGHVEELFNFFSELGCSSWGINIEEEEGVHARSNLLTEESVKSFWMDLFKLWVKNPKMEIREFRRFLDFANHGLANRDWEQMWNSSAELFPTVAWNGDTYLVSPEFAGINSEVYANFIAGNVLRTCMEDILVNAHTLHYIMDYEEGKARCKSECPYFAFCGGGQASNKFFENGSIATTQTHYCLYSKQLLADGIVEVLRERGNND